MKENVSGVGDFWGQIKLSSQTEGKTHYSKERKIYKDRTNRMYEGISAQEVTSATLLKLRHKQEREGLPFPHSKCSLHHKEKARGGKELVPLEDMA